MHAKFIIIVTFIAISNCKQLYSVQKLYLKGIQAYKNERWTECIAQFEESLHLYKLHKSVSVNCRLKCNSQKYDPEVKENIGDLKLYEVFFNRKGCLLKCQEKGFNDLNLLGDLDETVLDDMQARRPYEYLHICYFQMNALPKAASAAYTFLVVHPNDEKMSQNLEYYSKQPEVDVNEVIDLQSDDYQILYKLGRTAYNQNNWADAVANMEEVLTDYLSSENVCRAECEHQPSQEWSPELTISISNEIAALLHCQQGCQDNLKYLNYHSGVEFLADVLNYIQICYYRLNRIDDAAKAVSSYLMLLPNDEDMLENKKIYSTIITDSKSFSERSDITHYFKRDNYEKKLLYIFHRGNSDQIDSNTIQ